MIKPRHLKKGDKVAIVSLSSGILGEKFVRHELNLGLQRLQALGLEPVIMPHALKGLTYLKEHPAKRAADLKSAFLDDTIAGIICAIGGDDTYRLLPFLLEDQEFIHAVREKPKFFTGFSDSTVNHLLFYQLGMVSFYGPNLLNDLAELDVAMLPYTARIFRSFFENPATRKIVSSPIWYEERTDFSPAAIGTPRKEHLEEAGYLVLRGHGIVTGQLLGGCLDSFYDLLQVGRYPDEVQVATKFKIFPQAAEWQDKLLFIETSEECPEPQLFRKMLCALKAQGIFAKLKGILLGKPQNERFFREYKTILLEVTQEFGLPLMVNLNFGHAYPRMALPYGLQARLDLNQGTLTIMESFFTDFEEKQN
ncbi:S66 family peptidase [Liquorilactobacillus satsumensis]|uniref:S66 family peptidase n=1 Tax=Liquorilactobacillus satsumensis TaxID=259059 RepID=UPI0039EC1878